MAHNQISTSIISITSGPRQSNIELLRIIAMFLVLVVHSDFWALGSPDITDLTLRPENAITRIIIEFISIICVNVFILISGWFGIKFSKKGLSNFVFQCAYFLFGIYLFMLLIGKVDLSFKGLAGCVCLTSANWFIRAYVGLYILSPLLNLFLQRSSKHQIEVFLIAFFTFQTIWGWSGAAAFFEQGYSALSFCGLYILAGYIRTYRRDSFVTRWGGVSYVICIVLNSLLYCMMQKYGIGRYTYSYINPVTIIASLGLFLWFSGITIKTNNVINWVAKSSFAVFLLHTNPNIGVPIFKTIIINLYDSFYGLECIGVIFVFLICVFVFAVILDQPRKYFWSVLSKKIFK